jgi:carbon storage regulator
MALILPRHVGERVRIGDDIEIMVVRISRGKVRLGVTAPKSVLIMRSELLPVPGISTEGPIHRSPIRNICPTCNNSGYEIHPENGFVKGKRCPQGCQVQCSICRDPDCDNPGGQH